MSFRALHKLVTYVVAGLGLLALNLGEELGFATRLLIPVLFVVSIFIEGSLLAHPNYSRAWNGAVLAFFGVQVLRGFFGDPLLPLGLEFAAFLQLSRLCSRRSARDHQQIAVLAFLHLIAATVLSTSVSYGVLFVGFVVVTPWMLALSHLRREIEAHYRAVGAAAGDVGLSRVLRSRRVVGPRFLAGTALLSIPIFLVTATLFAAFPRVGRGFLTFAGGEGQRVSGFGRNVELGDFGTIRQDATVVMRVRGVGAVVRPPLRMRGTSFDRYDGRRWTRSLTGAGDLPRRGEYYPVRRWPDVDRDQFVTVLLDHLDEPVVFLPEGTVGLRVRARVRGALDVGRRLTQGPGLDIRYQDADSLGLTYAAFVADEPAPPRELDDLEREAYLQLPPGHERTAELARQLVGDRTEPALQARVLLSHLRDNPDFRYSLTMPETRGQPPLEAFLFGIRAGHCEYFSTALAIMLRSLGVPTRNVTGFLGGRYNAFGDYHALRQADAHSWIEAHLAGRWVTLDPTPAARDAIGPSDDALSDLGALVDAMRVRWSAYIVEYDLKSQMAWFRRARSAWSEVRGSRPSGRGIDSGPRAASFGRSVAKHLPTAALVVALAALGWWFLRRRRGRRQLDGPGAELAALYRELDRALAAKGLARPPARTPSAHAGYLAQVGFGAAETARRLTDRYQRARYGGEALNPGEIAELRRLLRQVRACRRRERA